MSEGQRPVWQRALRGVGIAGGVVGAAYAGERAVVAAVRRKPDPDAGRELTPRFDEARRIPSHDEGSIYTISRGNGPALLFSHGVTLNVRLWFKQFEELPERGFRWSRSTTAATAIRNAARPAIRSRTSPRI